MAATSNPARTLVEKGSRVCGKYLLERLLRRGPLASVYLARAADEAHARFVARVFHPERRPSDRAVAVFTRELTRLGTSAPPNTPPVVAFGLEAGELVVVTEREVGDTLRLRLERDRWLDAATLARVVTGVASTLDELHARRPPIVHGTVCPENVLLATGAGPVWLEESGVLHALVAAELVPRKGSPVTSYLPRELEDATLAPRTDIVMLASLACECLAGEAPFREAERVERGERITAVPGEPLARVSAVRGSLAPGIVAALRRAWNEDHATAGAFADDLAHALTGAGAVTAPPPPLVPVAAPAPPPPPSPASIPPGEEVDKAFDALWNELLPVDDDATVVAPSPHDARPPMESMRIPVQRQEAAPMPPEPTSPSRPSPVPAAGPPSAPPSEPPGTRPFTVSKLPSVPPPLPRSSPPPKAEPTPDRPTIPMPEAAQQRLRRDIAPVEPVSVHPAPPVAAPARAERLSPEPAAPVAPAAPQPAVVVSDAAVVRAATMLSGSIVLGALMVTAGLVHVASTVDRATTALIAARETVARQAHAAAPAPAPVVTAPPVVAAPPRVEAPPPVPAPPAPRVAVRPPTHAQPPAPSPRVVLPVPDPNLPQIPTAADAARMSARLRQPLVDCVIGIDEPRMRVTARYEGATGRVTNVGLYGVFAEPPMGPCVRAAVRSFRMPRFAAPEWQTSYVFAIPRP